MNASVESLNQDGNDPMPDGDQRLACKHGIAIRLLLHAMNRYGWANEHNPHSTIFRLRALNSLNGFAQCVLAIWRIEQLASLST